MTEEEKDTQTTPPEEAQTESKTEESVPEPEVVETVVSVASEVISEPVETVPETETAQMGGNEPLPETQNESDEATTEAQEKEPKPREREEKPTKSEPSQKEKLTPPNGESNYPASQRKETCEDHGTVCEAN